MQELSCSPNEKNQTTAHLKPPLYSYVPLPELSVVFYRLNQQIMQVSCTGFLFSIFSGAVNTIAYINSGSKVKVLRSVGVLEIEDH